MIESRRQLCHITLEKCIYIFTPEKVLCKARNEITSLVPRDNIADQRSPCKFLIFSSLPLIILRQIPVLNIKDT